MLRCGRSKSFMETHCSRLLWARFIPQKKQQNWKFLVSSKFQQSMDPVWMVCMCVAQTWQNVQFSGQQARSNRRVQEVVRVKQRKKKKNWNSIVLQRFEPPGFILRRSVGFQCFLRSRPSSFGAVVKNSELCCLTSDRCVGARVSLRSRRWFFLCGWPPVSGFRNETLTAFVFCVMFASIMKNRPVRGGFLFQLGLCGPNTKLCRWYRTFFEILLRFPAFFGSRGVQARFRAWCTAPDARQIAQRGSCQKVVKPASSSSDWFLRLGGRHGSSGLAGRFGSG